MREIATVLRHPEFRVLWAGRAISLVGDQLARVAVSILFFSRTGSAAQTGLVYAATYLPYLVGPWTGGAADRRSRRRLMIAIDLCRAALLTVISLPQLPLPLVVGLLALATALSPLYDAARSATLPDVVSGDLYTTGLALFTVTTEVSLVAGFGIGGAVVAGTGPHAALLLDAATFALVAVLTTIFLRERPPAAQSRRTRPTFRDTATLIRSSRNLRLLVGMAWMNAFWVAPEGLAAPYAARLHAGPTDVGLLLAAIPLGAAVGSAAILAISNEARLRVMPYLALGGAIPLVGCAFQPGLHVSLLLWLLSGLGLAYNLPANAAFVQAVAPERRGAAFATVTTGLVAGQGLSILVAGALADRLAPATVIAMAGLAATILSTALCRYSRASAQRLKHLGAEA